MLIESINKNEHVLIAMQGKSSAMVPQMAFLAVIVKLAKYTVP